MEILCLQANSNQQIPNTNYYNFTFLHLHIFIFAYLHICKLAHYLINVISPFLVVLVPSKNSTSSVYAYTSIGCKTPLYFPSQPIFLSFVSNTFCPHRFQIMNRIFEIPKPLANTLLLMSPLCG